MIHVRPAMIDVMLRFTKDLAERSTCQRAQQACVITDAGFKRVLAIGYNGKAKGERHECDSLEPGKCGCVHAEMNAVAKLQGAELDMVAFITMSPCAICARLLVNTERIKRVYYLEDYRDQAGKLILTNAGIETCHIGQEQP